MDLGLKGKIAIVTGATEGIGRAAALMFAREGAKVAICARKADAVKNTVAEIEAAGGQVFGMAADMGKAADVDRFMKAAMERFGGVDILVNNAGTSKRGKFMEHDEAVWAQDFDLKVWGAIRTIKLAVPSMRSRGGGRIVNLTNIGAKQPGAESTPTSISRAAGIALTKALSKEFAPDNILVNTVCIGKIKSGQHERRFVASGEGADSYYTKMSKDIPMGRVGEADEAAAAILFFAGAMGSYVTGCSLNLDGGISGVV